MVLLKLVFALSAWAVSALGETTNDQPYPPTVVSQPADSNLLPVDRLGVVHEADKRLFGFCIFNSDCESYQYCDLIFHTCQTCSDGTSLQTTSSIFKKDAVADLAKRTFTYSTCTPCTAGYYSTGGAPCQACPANTWSSSGAASCVPCPNGYTSPGGSTSQGACQPPAPPTCNAGFGLNNGNCNQCQAGSFSAGGSSQCATCPANTWSSTGAASCTACPNGYTSPAGSTSSGACIAPPPATCQPGYFLGQNGVDCFQCAYGSYSPGGPACQSCPPGTFSPPGAGSCTTCPSGYYADKSNTANQCKQCPTGTTNNNAHTACIPQSSAGLYRKRDKQVCPDGLTVCPLIGGSSKKGAFECVDVSNDIQSCGGCWGSGKGVDCTLFDPVASAECVRGVCKYSCPVGWILSANGCEKPQRQPGTAHKYLYSGSFGGNIRNGSYLNTQ